LKAGILPFYFFKKERRGSYMSAELVNVYEGGNVVARVRYNRNLDFWDGRNWTCGETGMR
jgi:hypothetical protein